MRKVNIALGIVVSCWVLVSCATVGQTDRLRESAKGLVISVTNRNNLGVVKREDALDTVIGIDMERKYEYAYEYQLLEHDEWTLDDVHTELTAQARKSVLDFLTADQLGCLYRMNVTMIPAKKPKKGEMAIPLKYVVYCHVSNIIYNKDNHFAMNFTGANFCFLLTPKDGKAKNVSHD